MISSWAKDADHTVPNVILCLLVVMIESLQLLIAVVLIFSFIPIPVSPFIQTIFPRLQQLVFLKRDMFFYRFWVGTLILGQASLLGILRQRLKSPQLGRHLRLFGMVEALWLCLMIFAVFKIFVYGYPAWGFYFLYAVLAASVLSKIFWKELQGAVKSSYAYLNRHARGINKAADIIFPLLIIGFIFVPDLEAAVARMWIGDCLHHMDSALMAQVWAYLNGAVLNVDIFAHYGLGMTIFSALLAKGLRVVSYTGVLAILIWATIIYFVLCYFFLRVWLKSLPVAIAGTLIAIKWQMFHPGNYPFIFTYPYSTVCRYFFDIIFLFLVLAHIRRGNLYFLTAAGAVCGLALFFVSDTGVYLTVAYAFYLGWLVLEGIGQEWGLFWQRTLRPALLCAAVVLLSAFSLVYAFEGAHTWSKDFWGNMTEQIQLFLVGHGDLPIYKSLLDGDYLASLVGFIIPLVYGSVFLAVSSLCFLKKINRQNIIVAVLCVYGMGLYHYYICRSASTSYYSVCIPFVFVLCWLSYQWGRSLNARYRHTWWAGIAGIAAFALFTNHAYLAYPNIFNFSANPIVAPVVKPVIKELPYYFNNIPRSLSGSLRLPVNSLGEENEDLRIEKDFKSDAEFKKYFEGEFAFREDAGLIDNLSVPGQAVALISSFETRILMQADRKPFFYYFPIIDSRPMHMCMFPFSSLLSTHRLSVTIGQLKQAQPLYVFMERILLARQVPKVYEVLYPELLYILEYLDKYYEPYRYGKYLVALKRI